MPSPACAATHPALVAAARAPACRCGARSTSRPSALRAAADAAARRGHRHQRQDHGHDARSPRCCAAVGRRAASRPATSAARCSTPSTTTSTWSSPRCRRSSSRSRPTPSRPTVAVLLNVADDHLDWHGTFDAYVAAKARVFAHQGRDDAARRRRRRPGRVARSRPTRAGTRRRGLVAGARRRDGSDVDGGGLVAPDGARARRRSRAAPRAAARPRQRARRRGRRARRRRDVDADRAARSPASSGLPHRVQLVGEHRRRAVRTTTPRRRTRTPPRSALAGFDRVVLLAGGATRASTSAAAAPTPTALRAVVAIGEARREVEAAFAGVRARSSRAARCTTRCARAAELAHPGDVVLLSPACASFDWYASYAARGDDFAREVAPAAASVHRDRHGGRTTASPSSSRAASPRAARAATRRRGRDRHAVVDRVLLVATVAVLNVVGLVMILSASSVASLSDYGSPWYFFDRQLMWTLARVAAPSSSPSASTTARWRRARAPAADRQRGAARRRARARHRHHVSAVAPLARAPGRCASSRASSPSSRCSSSPPTSSAGARASSRDWRRVVRPVVLVLGGVRRRS